MQGAISLQVSAGSQLQLECWDITMGPAARHRVARLCGSMPDILEHSRFLGQVNIPLSDTVPPLKAILATHGDRAPVNRTYHLARRDGRDMVAGTVTIAFDWSISARSLLWQKRLVMEKVLMQRLEILAMISPVNAPRSMHAGVRLSVSELEQHTDSSHQRETGSTSSHRHSSSNHSLVGSEHGGVLQMTRIRISNVPCQLL
jgi:hypothetical protein